MLLRRGGFLVGLLEKTLEDAQLRLGQGLRPTLGGWDLGDQVAVTAGVGGLFGFEKVGADVLYAPGLPDLAMIRSVCAALSKPGPSG